MDIYWISDKKKCGPATVPDVLSMVQTGELSPETKGWHAGCEQWMPLRELPALADFLRDPEPPAEEELPPVPEAQPERPANLPPNAIQVFLPSPAVRMLARLVDMVLYTVLVYGAIYVRQIPFDPMLLPSNPLVWVGFVVIEAALISYLGTTPGKALLGIHVRCVGEGEMTFGRALARACLVFIGGMGMMVSLLPLFMMGYSWWTLRSRGLTMWDARCQSLPLQFRRTTGLRQIMAVVAILVGFHITSVCMEPWFEGMVTAIEQQSPETAQWMRNLVPQQDADVKK